MTSRHSAAVIERAAERCEYCRMHVALQGATFHIEHVLPRVLGGEDALDNLALAGPSCNLHKAERTCCYDSITNTESATFQSAVA